MAIRFTEFIKHDNQEINLYIVQENQEPENLCFKVHIKDGEQGSIILCKNEENSWKISPQNIPDWMDDLKPMVISAIEKRISKNVVVLSKGKKGINLK